MGLNQFRCGENKVAYTYYVFDAGDGTPLEIFRGRAMYESFSKSDLERAKYDGTWSSASEDIVPVLNRWMIGDFDPEADALSESEALSILNEWREKGWPGRL